MTHVPLQATSFLTYSLHSSGFFPPWERPEFVKKSHFLDETTPAEKTSNREKRQEFYPFSSLQMTKVPCGRASDPALPPSQGFAVLGPEMWQKIRSFSDFWALSLVPEITSLVGFQSLPSTQSKKWCKKTKNMRNRNCPGCEIGRYFVSSYWKSSCEIFCWTCLRKVGRRSQVPS